MNYSNIKLEFLNELFQLKDNEFINLEGFKIVKIDSSTFKLEVTKEIKNEINYMIQKNQNLTQDIISEELDSNIDYNEVILHNSTTTKRDVKKEYKTKNKKDKKNDNIEHNNLNLEENISRKNIINIDESEYIEDE